MDWCRSTAPGHQPVLKQQENPEVLAELVEVESGAASTRPVLEEALDLCRKHNAALLVQKVDRITRDLEVLARIVKDPVTLRVASLPNADNFQIHLFGCLAARNGSSSAPEPRQHLQQQRQEAFNGSRPGGDEPHQEESSKAVCRTALKSHLVAAEQRQDPP